MKQTIYILLILVSSLGYGQVHEIFVSDTSQVDSYTWELEDTIVDFSFKDRVKQDGHWLAYYDRLKKIKATEATFNNGKLIGKETQWYQNGKVKKESICSDTLNLNFWEFSLWNSGGKLCMERKFKNDTCTLSEYYHDGSLKQKDIQEKDSTGQYAYLTYTVIYCENGQIKFSPSNFSSNEPQLILGYYCSGAKKSEWTWRNGTFIGNYKEWFENGKPKCSGMYDDEETNWTQTDKIGIWQYFNSEGKLIKQEKYENGRVTDLKEYK